MAASATPEPLTGTKRKRDDVEDADDVVHTPALKRAGWRPLKTAVRVGLEPFTRAWCHANPNWLFLFADNFAEVGTERQAAVRGAPNAVGIPSRKSEIITFTDDEYEQNKQAIVFALGRVIVMVSDRTFSKIVMSPAGWNTAADRVSAPRTCAYLDAVFAMLRSVWRTKELSVPDEPVANVVDPLKFGPCKLEACRSKPPHAATQMCDARHLFDSEPVAMCDDARRCGGCESILCPRCVCYVKCPDCGEPMCNRCKPDFIEHGAYNTPIIHKACQRVRDELETRNKELARKAELERRAAATEAEIERRVAARLAKAAAPE